MSDERLNEQREHDLTMQVFTISAGLVGVCLTAIGLMRIFTSHARVNTIADELLAADAVVFMVCCSLCFWSFKTRNRPLQRRLRQVIDVLFMIALAFMVVVCSLIAYAIV